MSNGGAAVANFVALWVILLACGGMIRNRYWQDDSQRRQLIVAVAVLLVCFVGVGRRLDLDDDVMTGLAGLAWTAVAAAYAYKIAGLRRGR